MGADYAVERAHFILFFAYFIFSLFLKKHFVKNTYFGS